MTAKDLLLIICFLSICNLSAGSAVRNAQAVATYLKANHITAKKPVIAQRLALLPDKGMHVADVIKELSQTRNMLRSRDFARHVAPFFGGRRMSQRRLAKFHTDLAQEGDGELIKKMVGATREIETVVAKTPQVRSRSLWQWMKDNKGKVAAITALGALLAGGGWYGLKHWKQRGRSVPVTLAVQHLPIGFNVAPVTPTAALAVTQQQTPEVVREAQPVQQVEPVQHVQSVQQPEELVPLETVTTSVPAPATVQVLSPQQDPSLRPEARSARAHRAREKAQRDQRKAQGISYNTYNLFGEPDDDSDDEEETEQVQQDVVGAAGTAQPTPQLQPQQVEQVAVHAVPVQQRLQEAPPQAEVQPQSVAQPVEVPKHSLAQLQARSKAVFPENSKGYKELVEFFEKPQGELNAIADMYKTYSNSRWGYYTYGSEKRRLIDAALRYNDLVRSEYQLTK